MQRMAWKFGWSSVLAVGRVVGVAAVLAAVLAALPPTSPADAQGRSDEPPSPDLVRFDEVDAGALLFHTNEPGWFMLAPQVATDIDVDVSGPLARTTVTQRFINPARVFVEGTYLFPLPANSAVDTLRMQVGDRWIEGRIETRQEARDIYEEATDAGQVATLVEQHRPDAFTTEVANIAPGAEVVVQIEFQQTLEPRNGTYGMRIPLVVAPRYVPQADLMPALKLTGGGWRKLDGTSAAMPAPPVAAEPGNHNPVTISIDLEAGTPLAEVSSPYHQVSITDQQFTSATVELAGPVPADRDFYLAWETTSLDNAHASAFVEHHGEESHYLAVITPPSSEPVEQERAPREVILVQDTSGSMAGDSLRQAREGLVVALERLEPEDTFNVIEFNSSWSSFARKPLPATARNIERATEWVLSMVSSGETDMAPALEVALRDPNAAVGDSRIRQIVFLTDGAVTNEEQLLGLIERDLGRSRLFTVGIGSAPNTYFMRSAAKMGRGSFVSIGNLNEVERRMGELFRKLESPAIIDVTVHGLPEGVEISPSPMPDLYVGDPVVLGLRVPEGVEAPRELRLVGVRGDESVSIEVPISSAPERHGIARLWARERIADLDAARASLYATAVEDRIEAEIDKLDAELESVALQYGLVSRLTSLVAVDLEITRPDGADSVSGDIATNAPAGWDADAFEVEQGGDESADVALSEDLEAWLEHSPVRGNGGVPIPQGGAGWVAQAVGGGALALMGIVGFRRRKRP